MTLSAIRRFLDQPDAVIFIGSGISCWSGLPEWKGLILELAKYLDDIGEDSALVRCEASGGDLLQAASYGFDKLSVQEIGTFIRGVTRLGVAKPHDIHKAIVQLGPTCFITTNYDNLLEQALTLWQSDQFYRPAITNMQLAEVADIMSARSAGFVFKPHGDASDSASIILTREQYRLLLPDGERHGALDALKTLLVTRPVLYLGFGLRDPDFLYLRDLLLNTFKGGIRDHWALMPDVTGPEIDYWRRQYGIRLFGYQTRKRADGSRDHDELLTMLVTLSVTTQSAKPSAVTIAPPVETELKVTDAGRILALTRYTAGLLRLAPREHPIATHVSSRKSAQGSPGLISMAPYENWTTLRFLTEGPSSALLLGLPGTGKSFSLRLAVNQFAQKIHQSCLDDTIASCATRLPVLIDLKLYQGNLRNQIEAALPAGFTLPTLLGELKLKLFLDAFNEMPATYLEEATMLRSLEDLCGELGDFDYVIASRTTDGLLAPSLPQYEIAHFDLDHVDSALREQDIVLSGHFRNDIRRLLSRPFFLRLVTSGQASVPEGASLTDIYTSYVHNLQQSFVERFTLNVSLTDALSRAAYRALDDGREAFPLSWMTNQLLLGLGQDSTESASEIINWLIARGVLTSYSGARASFVHQSITEYLAALELVRLVDAGAFSLPNTVALKKWDQCLFLALGMMSSVHSRKILDFLTRTELPLALNAARFAEEGQSELISELLRVIVDHGNSITNDFAIGSSLAQLLFGQEHLQLLDAIVELGGSLGGHAVEAVTALRGAAYKPTLFDLLEQHSEDFNFTYNGVASALTPLLLTSDLPRMFEIAVSTLSMHEHDDGACAAVAKLLSHFKPDEVLDAAHAVSQGPMPPRMIALLCEALGDRCDASSVDILSGLVLQANAAAVDALYMWAGFDQKKDTERFRAFTKEHVGAIWQTRFSAHWWDFLLHDLFHARPEFRSEIRSLAAGRTGIELISILYCSDTNRNAIYKELEALSQLTDQELEHEPFEIFDLNQLDWSGIGRLLVCLLARGNRKLTQSLVGGTTPSEINGLSELRREDVVPILEAAKALVDDRDHWWLARQVGSVVGHYGDAGVRTLLISLLAHGPTLTRRLVKTHILPFLSDITTDHLSEDAISFLLADLPKAGSLNAMWNNPLGQIATERFVLERLIPLARGASDDLLKNLRIVLDAAGNRHARRYLLPP